jgi:phosphoglycolate phosphatase-like HAD superfamily hydrolase
MRSPFHGDLRRAENTLKTIEFIQQVNSNKTTPKFLLRYRHYAGLSPLRCILLQHKSGASSGFLSFYHWHRQGDLSLTSTRDAASKEARIIVKSESSALLNAYRSWFSHLWGRHGLRALVFDFDDTLFSTTEAQITAWLGAVRALLNRGLISEGDVAAPLHAALDNEEAARSYIRDAFFVEQSEGRILAALIPSESKRLAVADELRRERWSIREQETRRSAQLVANLSPKELRRLGGEYALVIVSATSDKLIHAILSKWDLQELFPYVLGREAPRHDWLDMEVKTQNLLRVANILGIPLQRMAFVGDSDADYRSARQLGIRFIENRFNADFYKVPSLIRDPNPQLEGVLSEKSSDDGELARILARIEVNFDG